MTKPKPSAEDVCQDLDAAKRQICEFCDISQAGFDGSVKFEGRRLNQWPSKLPQDLQSAARRKLGFALEFYGYDPAG